MKKSIETVVRRDWEMLTEWLRERCLSQIRQRAESLGLNPLTMEQFRDYRPMQAIPFPEDRVFILPDIDRIRQPIDHEVLLRIGKDYPAEDFQRMLQLLLHLYVDHPQLFESTFQGIMKEIRRNLLKRLNSYIKSAPSTLQRIRAQAQDTAFPLPRMITNLLQTAAESMETSIHYAQALRDHLQSLDKKAPDRTSKRTARKNLTGRPEWSNPIQDTVDFLFTPETGINSACEKAAHVFQAVFPNIWTGPIDILRNRIYQRYYRITNPV